MLPTFDIDTIETMDEEEYSEEPETKYCICDEDDGNVY